MSSAGSRILASVRASRAYARGETAHGFVAHVPDEIDVRAIRSGLRLTQDAFARRFGFSAATIRDWEQGRRQPEQAARVLLMVIAYCPDTVDRAIAAHAPKVDAHP